MGLNYEKNRFEHQLRTLKSPEQKMIAKAKHDGFPNCMGLYPDCPETPSLEDKMCRSCPILEEE